MCANVSGANPSVTGAEEESTHVHIFQLWFAVFSLALSALLECGPEKLSFRPLCIGQVTL